MLSVLLFKSWGSFSLYASLFCLCCIYKIRSWSSIVMFWPSPRKNYIFLCLPGVYLLFSMCEGKKWAGVPSDVFVGVEHDDMVRKGKGFGPLGGKRRWGGWTGVEIQMHHRVLTLWPMLHVLLHQCMPSVRASDLMYQSFGWIHKRQETGRSPGWDQGLEMCLKRQIWKQRSILFFKREEPGRTRRLASCRSKDKTIAMC